MPSGEEADLEAFQRHVALTLGELLLPGGEAGGDEELLSVAWIRRLLEGFVICQEEFRVVVAQARRRGALPAAAERMVAEFHERAVKALDVCNAARDGVDQARRWERLAGVAASVLLAPPEGEIHEGQLRRARKALADLSALLVDEAAAAGGAAGGGVASFLASHRNRSFGRARASPSRSSSSSSSSSSSTHFRSFSWSVSRNWSAARQLQAIGAGLAAPRGSEASGLGAPAYAMELAITSALQHHAANLPSRFAIREHRRSGPGSPPSSGTGIFDAVVRYYRPPHESIPRRRLKIDLAAAIQKRRRRLASSPRHPRLPHRAQRRPCQGVPALPPPISSPSRSLLPPSIGLGFDSM
jgi:hypothetical protein